MQFVSCLLSQFPHNKILSISLSNKPKYGVTGITQKLEDVVTGITGLELRGSWYYISMLNYMKYTRFIWFMNVSRWEEMYTRSFGHIHILYHEAYSRQSDIKEAYRS